jgi:hypothetical protein
MVTGEYIFLRLANLICALLKEKGVMFAKKLNHFAKVCNSKSSNVHVNEVHT